MQGNLTKLWQSCTIVRHIGPAPSGSLAKRVGGAQKRLIPRSEFTGQVLLFPTEGKLMKKVLFATTALVATASVAAADVTFSGYGRFGVQYTDKDTAATAAVEALPAVVVDGREVLPAVEAAEATAASSDSSIDVTSRLRLQIDVSAESDAGVTFGARTRFQTAEGDGDTGMNGVRFFARSGGLEVGVGNIFGAIEFMPGMYPIDLGLTGLGYQYTAYSTGGADAYSSGGAGASGSNGVEVLYSVGDFSAHVSASDTSDRIAAHAAYTFSGWTVALGVQDSDDAADTELAASVGGSFGIADVTLAYADNGTAGDHIVLTGRFDIGAATNIEVYVADADAYADTSFGIDFNHDMGGGTSLRGGIASLGNNDEVRADMGVRFNF